ncbi:ATP-binding protein [Zarconia navalis]|uniref:ATP-binding protein n=1 Tax=Zarconia navalis TaxID=2992134 RepID=UPI0021F87E9A|nr:ATP-binding protein [Zarconia navalis]
MTDLRNFLEGVPVCSLNTPLKEVLTILRERKSERLAVVDAQKYPIGAIHWSSLLDEALQVDRSLLTIRELGRERASDLFEGEIDVTLSELEPSPIEPSIVLPVELSFDRLQNYLDNDLPNLTYAIVDSNERFLGLLDRHQLLRSLLQRETPIPNARDRPTAKQSVQYQQRIRELAAKNAVLVQQNHLKDELLAWLAHEFKTPLTSVSGLSHLLSDSRVGSLNPRQAKYIGHLSRSSTQLMKLVERVSDWTRIDRAELELKQTQVSLARVCVGAYQQARKQDANLPEISFTLDVATGLDSLMADELRLSQILVVLLSNALKFTSPPGQIGLQVHRWGDWIAFRVWDTGVGIPASQQSLIFHKFQQLANPLTQQFDGTGLSLAIAKRLARLHGGEITFISKEGGGSQFTLLLPRQASVVASDNSSDFPINPIVLIAETDPETIEALSGSLASFGYRAAIARSGIDALEKARQLKPHTLFVNLELPFLSGWDVLTLLGTYEETRNLRAIVITTEAERERMPSDRADGFLTLPVREAALRKVMSAPVPRSTPQKLTVLWLTQSDRDESKSPTLPEATSNHPSPADLNRLFHQHNCRVLEVDELEQADLLARVWKPDALILDDTLLPNDPRAYLEEIGQYDHLSSLPLVTLDPNTARWANQVKDSDGTPKLKVFPCLAPPELFQNDESLTACSLPALLQVIQVAAGLNH